MDLSTAKCYKKIMGILDSISKNPSFLALAALGIGLFIFRDRISGFFSDITGGAEGTAQIAETGGILARNLQSNLTQTPLPEDPLFGETGFFTTLGETVNNFFANFKLPEFPTFDIPSIPNRDPTQMGRDFTDVGMAAARARQQETIPMGFPSEGNVVRDLINVPFAVSNVPETQAQFQERSRAFAEAFPNIAFSTSLTDDISR